MVSRFVFRLLQAVALIVVLAPVAGVAGSVKNPAARERIKDYDVDPIVLERRLLAARRNNDAAEALRLETILKRLHKERVRLRHSTWQM